VASVNRENNQEILTARCGATVPPPQAQLLLASPQPEQIANPGHEHRPSFPFRHPSSTPHEPPHLVTYATHTPIQHPHSYPISYCLRDDEAGFESRPVLRINSLRAAHMGQGVGRTNASIISASSIISSLIASPHVFLVFFRLFFRLSSPPHFSFPFPHASHIFICLFFLLRGRFPQCG
jgi:hypothetical protein